MIDNEALLKRILENSRRQTDSIESLMDVCMDLLWDGPRRIGLPMSGILANMLFGYSNPGWILLAPYLRDLADSVEDVLQVMQNDFPTTEGDNDGD